MKKQIGPINRLTGHGFTLIEMLVVMAIIALLLTIAAPRYFGSLDKSKDVALQENLKVLRISIDKFYADTGHYPEALNDLVSHKYLRVIPIDPITESDKTWITIESTNENDQGIADIKSGAIGQTKDGKLYESF